MDAFTVLSRQQAMIFISDDHVQWCIYVPLSLIDLVIGHILVRLANLNTLWSCLNCHEQNYFSSTWQTMKQIAWCIQTLDHQFQFSTLAQADVNIESCEIFGDVQVP